MAVMNPCCCSLQTGAVIVAIFHMCMSAIFLIYRIIMVLLGVTVGLLAFTNKRLGKSFGSDTVSGSGRNYEDEDSFTVIASAWSVLSLLLITFLAVNIVFSILLLIGANQRNVSKCRAWLVLTAGFLVFYILYEIATSAMVIAIVGVRHGLANILFQLTFFLLFVIGTSYELWVVYAFVDELNTSSDLRSSGGYPGVVYSAPPKEDETFSQRDDYGPPPPYAPTTYSVEAANARSPGYPAAAGYPVLPRGKEAF